MMVRKLLYILSGIYFIVSCFGFFQRSLSGKFIVLFIAIISLYYLFYLLKSRTQPSHTLVGVIITNLLVQLTGGLKSPLFFCYFLFLPIMDYKEKSNYYWVFGISIIIIELCGALLRQNLLLLPLIFLVATFLIIGYVAHQSYLKEDALKKSLIRYEGRESVYAPAEFEAKAIITSIKDIDRHPGIERPLLYYIKFLHKIFSAYTTTIFSCEQNHLVLVQGFSRSELFYPDAVLEIKTGLYRQIIAEKKSVLIKEFYQNPNELGYYRGELKIASVIISPIVILNRVEGVVVIDRKENPFTEEEKILFDEGVKGAGYLIALLRMYEKERYEAKYLSAIAELAKKLQRGLELKTILTDTVKSFRGMLKCDDISIASIDELNNQGMVLKSTYLKEDTKFSLDDGLVGLVAKHKNGILKEDLNEGNLTILKRGEKKNRGSFVGVPIKNENELLGVIWLEDHRRERFNEDDLRALNILSSQLTLAWQRATLYERVKELSIRDGLTGLFNHRHLQEVMEEEIKKNRELVFILFDIDHFKKINDTYGHQAGDEVLKFIGHLISQTGIAGRYGGEEFGIILPGANLRKGVEIAVRLKDHIKKSEVSFNQLKIKFSLSLGIAHYPRDAKTRIELIEKADRALYAAKETGRDKIVIAQSLISKNQKNNR